MQETTGFESRNHEEGDFSMDYDLNEELNTYMRLITKVMKNVKIVDKHGFPKLLNKYLEVMKVKDVSQRELKQMLKLVKLFPLYLETSLLVPTEIRDLMANISNFVLLSGEDDVK